MKKYYLLLIFTLFIFSKSGFSQCGTFGSVIPSEITLSQDTLCTSGNISITVVGGSLGSTGGVAEWELYTGGCGTSCGGTFVASSVTRTFSNVNVSSNTIFYCKPSDCNCSGLTCVSKEFTIANPSIQPTSLSISDDTLCASGSVNFTVNGGSLGTLGEWQLLENSCSGSPIATSNSSSLANIPVNSSASYYVKAAGYCNTTSCSSVDFVLATNSAAPTSLSSSSDTICSTSNLNFTVNGGSLGTLAEWVLYENTCSGTPIDSTSLSSFSNISVSSSSNFYVKAVGFCNTTNCASTNILLGTASSASTSILSSDSTVCENTDVILSIDGGSLGTNANWIWFNDSCGGTEIGQGDTISINQMATTNYSVRAEGFCNSTSCSDYTITTLPHYIELDSLSIDSTFNPVDSTWFIIDSVCPQSAVKLFAHYSGPFPTSYSITWYENSCGSTPINVGDSIVVYPDSTTTYYARVVGTCGASLCKSIRVVTKDGSLAALGVTASANNFCTGDSTILSVDGGFLGNGAQWSWYKGTCSGNPIGSGASISITPASTTTYFVRATGGSCGSTACTSLLVNTYDLNMYHSPLDPTCENSSIVLEGGFPLGGTYSGVGITDSLFDPTISGIGTHLITYTYSDGNNCVDSIQTTIDVLESNPDPILITASNYEICNGNSTTLSLDTNSTLISGSKWVWYKEACSTGTIIDTTENLDTLWVSQIDGTYKSLNYTQVSPSTTTNYYVRSEGGQCPPSNCIGLTVDVYTLETTLNKFNDVCGLATPSFSLKGGNPSGGIYSGNGVTNNIFSPIESDTGIHEITYTYTIGQCVASDNQFIDVRLSPIEVYHSIEQETCAEGGIMIHAHAINGAGFYNYQWSDGSLENPLNYANSGDYNVLVADGNNCYTLLDSISIDSTLTCIEMVNTFSPNGDGLNDYWNLDFSDYENASLTIFNKWGNVLAKFDQTIIQWDAIFEGNSLPSGTYYYIVTLTESSGNEINQSGPVTILR